MPPVHALSTSEIEQMYTANHNAKSVSPSFIPCLQKFEFVPEWADDFLALFPHRGSFLWAEHPDPGDRPQWRTEERHLLSDRLILQGSYLYGVRFGKETNYLLIDIDAKSAYHPTRDPFAIHRILEAIEPLGLYKPVAVSSSYSDGIHLYFPFVMAQTSWKIAQTVAVLLESKGLKVSRGQLELFPNARRMSGADYNGHRLPLQAGSYLLNDDFYPIYGNRDSFVTHWRFAQHHNSVRTEKTEQVLKQFERKASKKLGVSAQKFLNDLNAEIEPGWSGYSQTNHILGKIAVREYVFHHALYGGPPLKGGSLWMRIVEVAQRLPGFDRWCRHQHEIEALAFDWCRSIEGSHYYPYGGDRVAVENDEPPLHPNHKRAEEARQRIALAVAELLDRGEFPAGARARNEALRAFGISSQTLYKNLDLWHPKALRKTLKAAPSAMIQAVSADRADHQSLKAAPCGMFQAVPTISLSTDGEAAPSEQASPDETRKAVGESEGFSTAPPLEGAVAVKLLINRIAQQTDRRRLTPPPDEVIPDERYFQQLEVALWRV